LKKSELTIVGDPPLELRLRSIQSAAGYVGQALPDRNFLNNLDCGNPKTFCQAQPDLRFIPIHAQAAFLRAVDLYHDTVLHDDVHGSEPQPAKRVAYLCQGIIDGPGALVDIDMRLMCDWLRHGRSFTGRQPPALPGVPFNAASVVL
jgi:hypothetical protein